MKGQETNLNDRPACGSNYN